MKDEVLATWWATFSTIASTTVDYLLLALAALAIAKAIDLSARLAPDRWLWSVFRVAGLGLAGVDLLKLFISHSAHAIEHLQLLA